MALPLSDEVAACLQSILLHVERVSRILQTRGRAPAGCQSKKELERYSSKLQTCLAGLLESQDIMTDGVPTATEYAEIREHLRRALLTAAFDWYSKPTYTAPTSELP